MIASALAWMAVRPKSIHASISPARCRAASWKGAWGYRLVSPSSAKYRASALPWLMPCVADSVKLVEASASSAALSGTAYWATIKAFAAAALLAEPGLSCNQGDVVGGDSKMLIGRDFYVTELQNLANGLQVEAARAGGGDVHKHGFWSEVIYFRVRSYQ